jgi:hypothetical protein
MGTRLGTLGFKVKCLAEFFRPKKRVQKVPADAEEIDYEAVFKNHSELMAAYKRVLKKDWAQSDDWFWFLRRLRRFFVESHIYKKLRSLRKIYVVEIAALSGKYDPSVKSNLDYSVENIDRFSGTLFHFPPVKTFISSSITIGLFSILLKHFGEEFGGFLSNMLKLVPARFFMIAFYLDIAELLSPIVVLIALLFIDKRRLFMKGWIYDKENKLFQSLNVAKGPETPIDIFLFTAIIILPLLITLSIVLSIKGAHYAYAFLLLLIPLFLWLRRKANNVA